MMNFMFSLWNDEGAITSVEYALLLAFVTAAIIASVGTLSTSVQNEFTALLALARGGIARLVDLQKMAVG